ncbi:cilia- and flagella-associated protein 300 [Takifugu rubripes]|uniref:Cilia- and flagella-associated protein 300 n=1 Tax=Takifugu rubripes TaxID=31033 RepID=A0A3B5K580_TAKRU|nr:cilia- and flagella-associated protein 300 [Takifugu rubripes]XP_029700634.1 cilia- and flagella-associated protein 300 [Takifugu rubripes]|eukprot:XP_003968947.1 PREDICTED: uncharacterized protein C11orf70 homolog [Takifugu rubripes]
MDGEFEQTFSFTHLPSKKFSFLEDKNTYTLLMKWSMFGRISAQTFTFDRDFRPYNSEKFALCFFQSPQVVSSLSTKVNTGAPVPLDRPVRVEVEQVPCTRVSMDLFDPIYTCGILRPSGHMVKCFHDVFPDYDELRQMLQDEESQHYYVVGREAREEFLFVLFKHLCLGGELCQYDDVIDPYMNATKRIYKDLISVQKDPDTRKISIISTVFKVRVYDESGRCYPGRRDEEQNFAYLIVNPVSHHVTLFSHSYGVGTFEFP